MECYYPEHYSQTYRVDEKTLHGSCCYTWWSCALLTSHYYDVPYMCRWIKTNQWLCIFFFLFIFFFLIVFIINHPSLAVHNKNIYCPSFFSKSKHFLVVRLSMLFSIFCTAFYPFHYWRVCVCGCVLVVGFFLLLFFRLMTFSTQKETWWSDWIYQCIQVWWPILKRCYCYYQYPNSQCRIL